MLREDITNKRLRKSDLVKLVQAAYLLGIDDGQELSRTPLRPEPPSNLEAQR